jgi:hypothetical protein
MKVILKSGYVIEDVEVTDSTKSVIGLWIWSTKQNVDQLLTFKRVTIRSSEIAAISEHETEILEDRTYNDFLPENLTEEGGFYND